MQGLNARLHHPLHKYTPLVIIFCEKKCIRGDKESEKATNHIRVLQYFFKTLFSNFKISACLKFN